MYKTYWWHPPPPVEVWASHPRQVWFSFDSTTVLSISELSPCVPRFVLDYYVAVMHLPAAFLHFWYLSPHLHLCRDGFRTVDNPTLLTQDFSFLHFVTTNRTGLAACKKSTHLHKLFPLLLQFVSQKCCEHSPAVIWNGFSKFQRPRHRFHI